MQHKRSRAIATAATTKDVKSFAEGYDFLLFTDNHMCIYYCATKNWLRASEAVAS